MSNIVDGKWQAKVFIEQTFKLFRKTVPQCWKYYYTDKSLGNTVVQVVSRRFFPHVTVGQCFTSQMSSRALQSALYPESTLNAKSHLGNSSVSFLYSCLPIRWLFLLASCLSRERERAIILLPKPAPCCTLPAFVLSSFCCR